MISYLRNLFLATYTSSEAEADQQRQDNRSGRRTAIVCVTVALALTMNKYFSGPDTFYSLTEYFGWETSVSLHTLRLMELGWWVGVLILFYFIVPAALITFVLHERPGDYGLKTKGAFKDYKLYLVMLAVMVPLVLIFSGTKSFQAKYPFYEIQKGDDLFPHFFTWEILYFLQFCALEFFFRGFMVHGTKQTFGFYAVFVMTIPYCMIHFGKPFPETVSAIIAGIVLGILSLKSRSIWLGIAIHYSVAISMDLAALWRKGVFG